MVKQANSTSDAGGRRKNCFATTPARGPVLRAAHSPVIMVSALGPSFLSTDLFGWGEGRTRYDACIAQLSSLGLPVGYLREVAANYHIFMGTDTVTHLAPRHSIELNPGEVSAVEHLGPTSGIGVETGVDSVYHESAHAFFDFASSRAWVSRAISDGTAYYHQSASGWWANHHPLSSTSAEHLFQEAVGEFVGARMHAWVQAYVMLVRGTRPGRPYRRAHVQQTENDFDTAMARRNFGYSGSGTGADYHPTSQPIPQWLRDSLDHHLLEDMIPYRFASVSRFQSMISSAGVV
jgi:hypothetical protein